jgi:type I pantothenate kinase
VRKAYCQRVTDLVAEIVTLVRERDARVVGITGGIAVGKSTVAAAVAEALGWPTVSTDGFIRADAGNRKGYAESYDAGSIIAFLDGLRDDGKATAPRYSHLHYDVVGYDEIESRTVVLDGLHLGHLTLGVRDRIDVLVHLDAPTDTLSEWYLKRFQELRTLAKQDPSAFLHPYKDLEPEVLDGMAMQVWRDLNAVVIETEVRPTESAADVIVRLGADHSVVDVIRR